MKNTFSESNFHQGISTEEILTRLGILKVRLPVCHSQTVEFIPSLQKSMLNGVGGVGEVGGWVHAWRLSNFGAGKVDGVSPQSCGMGPKNGVG